MNILFFLKTMIASHSEILSSITRQRMIKMGWCLSKNSGSVICSESLEIIYDALLRHIDHDIVVKPCIFFFLQNRVLAGCGEERWAASPPFRSQVWQLHPFYNHFWVEDNIERSCPEMQWFSREKEQLEVLKPLDPCQSTQVGETWQKQTKQQARPNVST